MKDIIIVGYNSFSKEVIDKIKEQKNIKIILDDLTSDTLAKVKRVRLLLYKVV